MIDGYVKTLYFHRRAIDVYYIEGEGFQAYCDEFPGLDAFGEDMPGLLYNLEVDLSVEEELADICNVSPLAN